MKTSDDLLSYLKGSKKKAEEQQEFPLPFHPSKPIAPRTVEGDVGIEVEAESSTPDSLPVRMPPRSNWQAKADGSLRNGLEYVLRAPISVNQVSDSLAELVKVLSKENVNFQNSNRTSTHVHINIQGMKVNEITSFIILWCLFEPLFISWCGEQRTSNHFCLSNQDTQNGLGRRWLQALKSGSFRWDRNVKYSSLNLATIDTFGSLEFRCMRGLELDHPDIIENWVKILYGMREEAREQFADPLVISEQLSEFGATNMLRNLCEKYDAPIFDELLRPFDGNQDIVDAICINCFREVQDLCFVLDWRNWMDRFNAVFIENPFEAKPKQSGRRGAGHWVAAAFPPEPGILHPMPVEEDEDFEEDVRLVRFVDDDEEEDEI